MIVTYRVPHTSSSSWTSADEDLDSRPREFPQRYVQLFSREGDIRISVYLGREEGGTLMWAERSADVCVGRDEEVVR